ncbi:MAG: arginine N-succinyltransferase [Tatlockia sp.]|nr:arginine N-succinyltransferase [Tatlockia sp.]
MMIFRSAQESDLDAIHHLIENCGIGMTSLPKDKAILKKRLDLSCTSFNKAVNSPEDEYYLFVLEDPKTSEVVGISAIEAATGHELPLYSFKVTKSTNISHSLNLRIDYEVLHLVNDNQGRSELCSLYLKPEYRHRANGLLLSRARLLFIAHYPNRFAATIIAEMRGISDEWGYSPFWEAVGSHFFQMNFAKADELTAKTNKQFIADLMPKNPLYVKLLPAEAQAVIGKPHNSTIPAMNILMREGFRYNCSIDIFDGGPTIEAPCNQICTVATNRVMTVKGISDEASSKLYILANTKLDFRATIGKLIYNPHQGTCIIGKETAELLKVKHGDCLRITPLQIDNSPHFSEENAKNHEN